MTMRNSIEGGNDLRQARGTASGSVPESVGHLKSDPLLRPRFLVLLFCVLSFASVSTRIQAQDTQALRISQVTVMEPTTDGEHMFVEAGGILLSVSADGPAHLDLDPDALHSAMLPSMCLAMHQHDVNQVRSEVLFSEKVFQKLDFQRADCESDTGSSGGGPGFHIYR